MIASCDSEGEFGFENDAANAAFIVRAANSHDALVEALKEAEWAVASYAKLTAQTEEQRACANNPRDGSILYKIRAALKLAEVGQ